MSEMFELEYNVLQEMLIVNHQEGFSYNMNYEDDVYIVTSKLNEQQSTIQSLKDFIIKEFPKSYKHILEGLDE